jgi:hypothetical protein
MGRGANDQADTGATDGRKTGEIPCRVETQDQKTFSRKKAAEDFPGRGLLVENENRGFLRFAGAY